jgi:PAS domain S-box-containing protein
MSNRHNLPSKLEKARQQLQKAQSRVAELETQLFEEQPNLAKLATREDRYRHMLDNMLEGCQIIGFDWHYLYVNNEAAASYERCTKEELLDSTLMERHPGIEKTPVFAVLQRCMQERSIERIENEFTYPDGASARFELLVQPVPDGIFILSQDITQRKRTEEVLRRTEIRFQSLVEAVEDYAIYLLDTIGNVVSWNTGAERLKGYRSDEIIGQHFSRFFTPEDQQSDKPGQLLSIVKEEGRAEVEGWRVRKDRSRFWANVVITALRNPDGSLYGFAKITRDLTQRKHAEENIRKLHRTLSVLSDINQAIVRIRYLPSLFEKACQIAVEKGTFQMAWIGLFDSTTGRIDSVTHAGISDNDLEKLIDALNTQPLISTLRAEERLISNDIQNDPLWLSWREAASRLGYRATVALPLIVAGEIRGIFNLYADELDFFDTEELRLMDEMAGDISLAMEMVEQDEQRSQAEAAVKRYTERMKILHEIDLGLIEATSIEAIFDAALIHIRSLFACQQAIAVLFDYATNEAIVYAVNQSYPSIMQKGGRFPAALDRIETFGLKPVMTFDDLSLLPDAYQNLQRLKREGMRSALLAQLTIQGHQVGLLSLSADTVGFFTAEHREIAGEIANQLAIAIHQMQLSEEIARHTVTLEHEVAERTADVQAALVRVEAILNNSPDAILLANADLTIQQVNSSFNTLFDCEWDAYFGQSLLTLLHDDDAHRASDLLEIAANPQNGKRIEVRAVRRDGATFDAELSIGVIKGDGLVCILRDITERKAQEHQLRYHASLQESVSDAVFVMDMEFTIQSWNKASELIYGWTGEEAIGTHANAILRNQLSEEENHRLFAQLIEQSFLIFDLIQHHKEGYPLNIWCSMTLIKDIDGHPVGILSVNHDITERKVQERQLRYYASFQEHISDAVIAIDTEFHIQSWNKAAERIYGWTADEVIGKTVRDVLHTQHPKGVSREIAKQELANSHEWHNEVRQKHKNGNWLDISASVSQLTDEKGVLIGAVAVNRDITEHKAQERQLRYYGSIQESVSDAVIATDMDFRIQSWNHAAETIYGWSAAEAIGKPVNEVVQTTYESEADRARILKDFFEYGAWQGEVIQRHRDGSPINILASANLFKDETGQPFGVVSVNRDISERKRIAEALQKSAAEIRDLYNNAPCGYHSIDKDGLIVQINDTELQWLGYTRDEVIGKLKVTDIYTPESVAVFGKEFPAFLERGWVNDLEFDVVRKDGSIMHILLNATAVYDDNGQYLKSRSTLFDITQLQQAQQTVVKSEALYRLLAENISDVIAKVSPDGIRSYITPSCFALLGYTPDELVGRPSIELVHPDDGPTSRAMVVDAINTSNSEVLVTQRVQHKAGHYLWVEVKVSILRDPSTGSLLEVMMVMRDITKRKRVEESLRASEGRYRLLAENIADIIMTFSLDQVITYMSPSCERLLGYLPEEVEGKSHSEFIHPEDYPQVTDRTLQAVISKEAFYTNQFRLRHKAGHYIWYEVRTRIVLDPDTGKVGQFTSVLRDITERRRANESLRVSEERLRTIIENIPVMISFFDAEGRFEFVNQGWLDQVGWTVEDLTTAEDPLTLFYPDPEYRQQVLEYMLSAEPGWRDFKSQTKHRGERITSWANVRLSDGRGIGIGQDITERKQAETALRESEERFRRAIIDAPFPIMIHAEDGEIIQISKSWTKLSGYTHEEIPTIGDWTEKAYGNRRESVKTLIDTVYERTEPLHGGEFRIRTKSDEERIWDFIAAPLGLMPDGRRMVSSMAMDITERKRTEEVLRQSEERFALVFRFSPVAIALTTSTEGRYLDVNDSLLKLLGYSRDEMIGRTASDLNVWRALEEREVVIQTMREKGSVSGLELGFRQKNGEICTTLTSIVPVMLNGQSCLLSIVQDITERKRAELALNTRFEEEREFQGYLKALHEISIELTQIDELDTFYKCVVQFGREQLGFERLALFLYDEENGNALGTYGTDTQGNITDERSVRFAPDPNAIMLRALNRSERFYFEDNIQLFNALTPVGNGWNAAAVLWNGTYSLGWLVVDNLLHNTPASKPLLDILGLYALTVGTLLAQKQAQIALRESEERFRQIAENFDQVLYIASVDHQQMLYINPHYETLYGKSAASVYEKPDSFMDVVHPDDLEIVRHHLAERRYVEEGFADFENRIIPHDGPTRWVRVRAFPIMADDGSILRRAGIIEDITASKQVAAELERQRIFLRNVIDVSPSLIFVKDYDGRFVLANPSLAKLHNTTTEFLIGKSDAEINPLLDEVENFVEADRHVIDTGESLSLEELVTDAHGLKHWFHTTKVQISSADGYSKHLLGIATDITELKNAETELRESEARFRMLVDAAPVAIVITNQSGHISLVNNQAQSIFGYERGEMLDQPVEILLPHYMHERHIQHRTDYLAAPTIRPMGSGLELQARRKDNTLFPVEIELSYIKTRSGLLVMSFVVDITKRKEAEVALLQALAKEKELGELKTRFVSMASHEFRTPLATILALVETLSAYRHKLSEEQIEQRFDKIKDQVGLLKDIMEDVLMLARMQARRVEFNPVKLDLDALCQSVLDEFANRDDARHRVKYTVSEGVQAITLDRKLMRQMITNLVTNALKYSPEDKTVNVTLEYTELAVILKVRDEGIGIPEADMAHLFEPFHRATNVGTISGTGLGLVITKESVEMHKGTITVESQIGVGTTFIIHIPLSNGGIEQ